MSGESKVATIQSLRDLIRDVPDFPSPGIVFKDISPLIGNSNGLAAAVAAMAHPWRDSGVDLVVGIEARGFLLGPPVALELDAGFVPVRKAGKLPWETVSVSYGLEYGADTVEMHTDAIASSNRVIIIDDVLATGGTAAATAKLVAGSGADLVGLGFLIELDFLSGRSQLSGNRVESVLVETS